MLRIGAFARMGRVSIDTLRHYDAIGLLRPARVDERTGYRLYAPLQLARLRRIQELKDLGLSLRLIKEAITAEGDPAEIERILRWNREMLIRHLRETQLTLARIEAQLIQFQSGSDTDPVDPGASRSNDGLDKEVPMPRRHDSLSRRDLVSGAAATAAGLTALRAKSAAAARFQEDAPPPSPLAGTPSAASRIDTTNMVKGGRITLATPFPYPVFSPIVTGGYDTWLMFEGLVYLDQDTWLPKPLLAESWEFAPDNSTITFHLKPDVTWHDGQPFTADDVKFTFDLIRDPATASPFRNTVERRFSGVDVLDPETVVLRLVEPSPKLLVEVAKLAIAPRHLLAGQPPAEHATSEFTTVAPIGTGPFRFGENRPGEFLLLQANRSYHRGVPNLDQVVFKEVPDQVAGYQQLKTGEVDWAYVVPDFAEDALAQESFLVTTVDETDFDLIGFNLNSSKTDLFQDPRVRQALGYAIDRPLILERVLKGLGVVAPGTMPPASWAFRPEAITTVYNHDPGRAEALLDEAGWLRADGGTRAKNGRPLAFDLHVSASDQRAVGIALAVQPMFEAIGVEVTPQVEDEESNYARYTESRDFAAIATFFGGGSVDPDQTNLWGSGAQETAQNHWAYSNPRVDDLLARALKTFDLEERAALYVEMQNIVVAEAPVQIIDFRRGAFGLNRRIRNLIPASEGWWNTAHFWYAEDGR